MTHNCSRDELPEFFKHLGFKVGAEIGVYKGEFTEKFCQKGLKMYAIDNWLIYKIAGVVVRGQKGQDRQDHLYESTKKRLASYKDCVVIRKNSMDAVADFAPESLDFVYLDADHSFRGIADDLYEWYWRVKKGGIISGHDYAYTGTNPRDANNFKTYCHVKPVLDTFIKAFGVENYYIFGRPNKQLVKDKNDIYLSWLFFKP